MPLRLPHLWLALRLVLGLAAWLPVAVLLWTNRPYLLDLLAMLSAYVVALYALLALLLAVGRWRRAVLNLASAALVLAVIAVVQSYPPAGGAAFGPRRQPITVISFNCHGNDPIDNPRFVAWAAELHADVISLLEPPSADGPLRRMLQDQLGYRGFYCPPAAVFSRCPVQLVNAQRRAGAGDPAAAEAAPRFALTLADGTQVHLVTVHLKSPRREERWERAAARAQMLGVWLRGASGPDQPPLIVAGDFNSTPLGRSFQRFSQFSGLRPAGASWPATGTWPAGLSPWLALPIDHIWVDARVQVLASGVGPNFGTIHRPVWARLTVSELPEAPRNPATP